MKDWVKPRVFRRIAAWQCETYLPLGGKRSPTVRYCTDWAYLR